MGAVSILFYVLFTLVSSSLLLALIGSVGLMIAFYYGMTGYACVWYYRKTFTKSARDFMMRGVVPLLGAVMLTVVFGYGLIQYAKPDYLVDDDGNNVTILGFGAVAVVGIGALVLGVILMFVWWAMSPGFFTGKTLPRRARPAPRARRGLGGPLRAAGLRRHAHGDLAGSVEPAQGRESD